MKAAAHARRPHAGLACANMIDVMKMIEQAAGGYSCGIQSPAKIEISFGEEF
ncbi:hypothetical protein [Paraburkholderia sacchari]|uniref:Uncharacterized protein n=1 Tax=Paraburkholderia sacchari TaxID=159450 RepID=A0A8T6Z4P5_9BURK|nr:hypothetical protein [Paraburkholderia sacchari]NLP59996.1 hypothetical protein [Paraburkholderia sacchari]